MRKTGEGKTGEGKTGRGRREGGKWVDKKKEDATQATMVKWKSEERTANVVEKKKNMSSTGQKCSSYKNRGYLHRDSSPRGWGPRRGTPAAARTRGEGIRGNVSGSKYQKNCVRNKSANTKSHVQQCSTTNVSNEKK